MLKVWQKHRYSQKCLETLPPDTGFCHITPVQTVDVDDLTNWLRNPNAAWSKGCREQRHWDPSKRQTKVSGEGGPCIHLSPRLHSTTSEETQEMVKVWTCKKSQHVKKVWTHKSVGNAFYSCSQIITTNSDHLKAQPIKSITILAGSS